MFPDPGDPILGEPVHPVPDQSSFTADGRWEAIQQTKQKYGLRPDLGNEWFDANGQLRWPPNQGAAGTWTPITLQPGTIIDRYGPPSGSYFAPAGTPFAACALPSDPSQIEFHTYRVLQPLHVQTSQTAAWFGKPGGGIQFLTARNVNALIKTWISGGDEVNEYYRAGTHI